MCFSPEYRYTTFEFMRMNKKVLVINNTTSPISGAKLLIKEGYTVNVVHNSDEGLQQLDTQAYDIIILQENREAESWWLCEKIRHLSSLPLIVISQNASTDNCVKAINAGADYFLRKPFGPMELIARMQSLIYRSLQKQLASVSWWPHN
jgi:DNA-binding response OmpR family regulator